MLPAASRTASCSTRSSLCATRVPTQWQTRAAPRLTQRPFRCASQVCASTVRDEACGAEFQLAQQFWDGETMRCLGAATKFKKILMLNVKVYSVAVYVEATKCAKELGIRARGGFFESDGDFCSAIMDGAFQKVLAIRLVRDVDGETFAEAINKSLVPRMQMAGELDKLNEFCALFQSKKLTNGTEVLLFCSTVGDVDVLVVPHPAIAYAADRPELRVKSMSLCRGLLELYLGSSPVVPDGQKIWADGAKNLLDYENVKRSTRKAGTG